MKYTIKKTVYAEFSKDYEVELNENFIKQMIKQAEKSLSPETAKNIKDLNLTVEEIRQIVATGGWCVCSRPEVDEITGVINDLCCDTINDETASIVQDWTYWEDIEEDEFGEPATIVQLLHKE